jgi:2-(1,2-epoxy-1,2-dihydrophenyl)acetyl-CoA isomerase
LNILSVFNPRSINEIMNSIDFEIINGIAKITLNNPQKYNAFYRAMALELQAKLDDCQDNDEIRAVYLTGSGKAFCAGQDLEEAISSDGPELTKIVSEHYNPIILQIRNLRKPVVAAVNGVAAGAGANIALACDIVVADEHASFIQAFSKIGLIPDSGGTFFLPRILGLQKASALMMLGDKVSATEAENLGMIYKVFNSNFFGEKSWELAEKLAKMPTYGLWLTKKALNESFGNSLIKQLALEDELQSTAGESYDYKEGVDAFLEKRMPDFKGK